MTDLQAIEARSSRRSYTGGVPAQHRDALTVLCKQLSEKHGVKLELQSNGAELFGGLRKSYGMFTGVQDFFVLAAKPEDENGAEKLGYAGEILVLEATKLFLGTCWVAGTFAKSTLASTLAAEWKLYAVITVGTVPETVQGREKFIYRMVHRKSKTGQDMTRADSPVPEWFARGAEAVAKAPSAVHAQPVILGWEKGVASASVPNGQLMDLGIAKLHFELAAGGSFHPGNGGTFQPGRVKEDRRN